MSYLWIFLGGGLGSVARFAGSGLIAQRFGSAFPWGTLVVNVTGCFVIGCFATLSGTEGRWIAPTSLRQFFMIGVCGGYTTFSTFSLEALTLAQNGEWFKACANAMLSLGLCLLAVWLGHLLAAQLSSTKGL